MIILKSAKQIRNIHKSCIITAHVLKNLKKEIKVGTTTKYLNTLAEELCYDKGGIPGFKGYQGFPFAICASKNDEIVHGFPDNIPLKDGDILSIDFGTILKGWYSDSAFTVSVGNVAKQTKKLIEIGKVCLHKGIEAAVSGNRIGDISNSIQYHAESNGFQVVKDFTGHGIGKNLHEKPPIPNFGNSNEGIKIKSGMVLAIEPMLAVCGADPIPTSNGWTMKTSDGLPSVHFEHTVAITDNGVEVLTKRN